MPYGRKCAFNQPYIISKAYHVRMPWFKKLRCYDIALNSMFPNHSHRDWNEWLFANLLFLQLNLQYKMDCKNGQNDLKLEM